MAHVVIVGGGIAGLATAFYLQKKSHEAGLPVDYTLVESKPRLGGKIITKTVNDFVIEGGPDSFVTIKPWGTQLCKDLNLEQELIPTNDQSNNVYIVNKGKLVKFPSGYRLTVPTEFIPFALSPLISPMGKLRMAMDLVTPPRAETGDESLADFIRRRLGNEALDKIAGPIMAGIYSADPERLSMQSTFPQFLEMERQHGSLIKAMQQAKKKRRSAKASNGHRPPMFTSLKGGMTTLVEALTRRLEGELAVGQRVTRIRRRSTDFEVVLNNPMAQSIAADAVALATPAYVTADLVESFAPQLAVMLREIRYVSTATVSLGYRRADVIDQHSFNGFGFLIPRSEDRRIRGCTWTSTKFDHRAPEDDILLRVFVGGAGHEEVVGLPDHELFALVQREIAEIMGVTAKPVVREVFRWIKGNPQYDVGHLDRVSMMEQLAGNCPGLYLTGSAFRGIGIPDCIKSALKTADDILSDLHQVQP